MFHQLHSHFLLWFLHRGLWSFPFLSGTVSGHARRNVTKSSTVQSTSLSMCVVLARYETGVVARVCTEADCGVSPEDALIFGHQERQTNSVPV